MIHTLHDKEDLIYAYVVFDTVDIFGKWKNNGDFIFIKDMWVHPEYRKKETVLSLYEHIYSHPQTGNAKQVYWERGKHNQRVAGPYDKNRLLKLGGVHK